MRLKRLLADPRFDRPYSGGTSRSPGRRDLCVGRGRCGTRRWRSTRDSRFPVRASVQGPDGQQLWVLRRAVTFPSSKRVFQIAVAADVQGMRAAIAGFTETLVLSLVMLGLGLIVAVVIQVRYGLSPLRRLRAALAAGGVLGARTGVTTVAEELRRALSRIHADRGITITVEGDASLVFLGDRQDLQEMLGNLMDNACKWVRASVRVHLGRQGERLRLRVEDDGSGLAPEVRARVFDRGQRDDEAVAGSGLGLAIVRDVAALYDGEVSLGDCDLGGLGATLDLPAGD